MGAWKDGCMEGWKDGWWMDGQMHERMDRWTGGEEWMSGWVTG